MKWSIGNKIASAFGLALAALLVVGAVSHDSTAKLIDSAEWVTHAHQVVTALEPLVASRFAELRSTIGAGRPTPPDSGHGT